MNENKIEIWAKSKQLSLNENGELAKIRIVTLVQHIQDVIEVFENLCLFLPEQILSKKLRKLIEIIIQYHDIGKVLPYFQRKTIKNENYVPFEVFTNIPHSILSSLMINIEALENEAYNILGDKNLSKNYIRYILSSVAYHHWRENFYDIIEGQTDIFQDLRGLHSNKEKWNQIEKNINQVYRDLNLPDWFQPYLNERWLNGLNNGIKYADYVVPPYQLYRMPKRLEFDNSTSKEWVLMSGFTMLSDHFASYIESLADSTTTLKEIEIKGIGFAEIKNKIEEELKWKIGESFNPKNIWQFNSVEKYKEDNLVLLAPTGMGKTEFAYLWSNGEKFFYTLPLRTAVNQIFSRTQKVFGIENTGILHSDADIFIYGDGGETESMRIYETAKQLSSPAIISTGDQFFPYAMRPPSYERIFAKFSYSRLIIDEVQAYDPKAAAIIVKFIEHVVQMGGRFLLMTATLPEFIKKEITERIGLIDKNFLNLFKENKDLSAFAKHKLKVVIDKYVDDKIGYNKSLLNQIISKAKEKGGSRIIVVMNTVKQAQAVYNQLGKLSDSTIEIKIFHSRYTQKHRRETEDSLGKFIGNNVESRNDKRPKILVATQVVEASLDLDADYLFTELAPWDSLIQRMGRCFRELRINSGNKSELVKKRYHSHNVPDNVFVIIYDGKRKERDIFESSNGFVYNRELLRTTLKLIQDKEIKEDELKKWNNASKQTFKRLDKIEPFLLTERDKSTLVDKLFRCLPDRSKYLKDFYNMLQLLDSGFMSDRKSDAQKAFREINNVDVIAEDKIQEFYSDIKGFDFFKPYAYTDFKSKIISKYTISIQRNKVTEYLYESYEVPYRIKSEGVFPDNAKMEKLKSWLWGVYFIPLEYSEFKGLIGVKEEGSYAIL